MERVELNMPEKVLFTTRIPLRITDMNYSGHLGNDAVLSIAHEARIQFFSHFGFTEMNLGGTGIIMADAAIKFISEAFAHEVLDVTMSVDGFTRVGFSLFYHLRSQNRDVAIIRTNIVCFDYENRKVVSLPPHVKDMWI